MVIFDDSGHLPNFEEPDEFNQLVARWLSETDR
jgi:pimeloyl-ACP methyl ester carboxylesterase